MVKQAKTAKADKAGKTGTAGPRRVTILAAALLVAGTGLAVFDLARERRTAYAEGDASIQGVARVAEALWGAEDARIQALLARLRIELRANGCFDALSEVGDSGVSPEALRRIDNLLQRAAEGAPELVAFDLVVAGQAGLSDLHFEPGGGPLQADEDDESESRAKTLWYAEDVSEAVESNGRRVARSGVRLVAFGEGERALVRAGIALHGADEVVQGALVATLDLAPLGTRLASLSSEAVRFALVTAEGARIGGSLAVSPEQITSRVVALEPGAESPPSIVEDGGRRSLLRSAVPTDDVGRSVYFWIESDSPPSLAASALRSPWLLALGGLAFALGLSIARERALAARAEQDSHPARAASRPGRAQDAPAAGRRSLGEESGSASGGAGSLDDELGDADPVIRRERFVLRDWLADVRGCLEREAASRGLTLVLRCERSLPREIEQDPLWLGGLLVSLGREALDATSETRVALEVSGGDGHDLRFDLDAGEADLDAVGGMDAIVGRLGGSLEKLGRGRLAVVLPGALA